MKRINYLSVGLILLILSVSASAQDKKVEFSTGVAFSYNVHTGDDFVPGDTVVDYSNASSFIQIPHPPYYYHNCVSYRITPIEMRVYPFSNRVFYSNFQLLLENNRESRTTPIDSILYYEPYYLPHGARFPIQRNISHKSVFISGSIGFQFSRFSVDFGAKLLFISWRRAVDEYYDTGVKKYASNDFFLLKDNRHTVRVFQPIAAISYEFSQTISIKMTVYPYEYNYFAYSIGINKMLGK